MVDPLPSTSISIALMQRSRSVSVYFNGRSLVPKFDELCLIVSTHNPDTVVIVESWLCPDISDHDINTPGYQLFRLDRNRHPAMVVEYCCTSEIVLQQKYCPVTTFITWNSFLQSFITLVLSFVFQIFIVPQTPPSLFLIPFFVLWLH